MYRSVSSMGLSGIEGYLVTVEADLSRGLPCFELVGLPDTAVREARDRVRAVMLELFHGFPQSRIVVNLAPAGTKKTGSVYDLPILAALMLAAGQVDAQTDEMAFVGELSLSGQVRPVTGVLSMVLAAREAGKRIVFVPAENAAEAAVVEGVTVLPLATASQLVDYLRGGAGPAPAVPDLEADAWDPFLDFAQVRGQEQAKRALEVAAAGSHNVLLLGPPGTGKSMLAKRIPSILPPLSRAEALATTRIYSVAGLLPSGCSLVGARPFRSPHHSTSQAGLTGGGTIPKPGEISLAHNGVLFLDELPEFEKRALEALRQPLEDGVVTIARAQTSCAYPAKVMVVAAMNPCPCGYFGHPTRSCSCGSAKIATYLGRVSGPLLERLDLHVEVPPVDYVRMANPTDGEPSAAIRQRVIQARQLQRERMAPWSLEANAHIPPALLRQLCPLSGEAGRLLEAAFGRLGLSGRSYDRILKVARTIADLEAASVIGADHIAEAVQYRDLDRRYWSGKTKTT